MIFKIIQPCHFSWSDLDATDHPKQTYCSSCNNCIHDFRDSTEEEILATVISSSSRVCGILPDNSYEQDVIEKPKRFGRWSATWILLVALSLFSCKTKKPTRPGNPGFLELQDLSVTEPNSSSTLNIKTDQSSD